MAWHKQRTQSLEGMYKLSKGVYIDLAKTGGVSRIHGITRGSPGAKHSEDQ